MKNIVNCIILVIAIIGVVVYINTVAEKEYNYITANSTPGKICSDSYTSKEIVYYLKSHRYTYKVKYKIGGKTYTPNNYKSKSSSLSRGDTVLVYFNSSNPGTVVQVEPPVFGMILIMWVIACTILGINGGRRTGNWGT